jgi:hypothetical protein
MLWVETSHSLAAVFTPKEQQVANSGTPDPSKKVTSPNELCVPQSATHF